MNEWSWQGNQLMRRGKMDKFFEGKKMDNTLWWLAGLFGLNPYRLEQSKSLLHCALWTTKMNEAKAAAVSSFICCCYFWANPQPADEWFKRRRCFCRTWKPFFVLFRIKMMKPKEAENLKRVRVLNLHTNNHCRRQWTGLLAWLATIGKLYVDRRIFAPIFQPL